MKRLRLYSEADVAQFFYDTRVHPNPALKKRAILTALMAVAFPNPYLVPRPCISGQVRESSRLVLEAVEHEDRRLHVYQR